MTSAPGSFSPEVLKAVQTLLNLSYKLDNVIDKDESDEALKHVYIRTITDTATNRKSLTLERGGFLHPIHWLSRLFNPGSYRITKLDKNGVFQDYETSDQLKALHDAMLKVNESELEAVLSELKIAKPHDAEEKIRASLLKLRKILNYIAEVKADDAKKFGHEQKVFEKFKSLNLYWGQALEGPAPSPGTQELQSQTLKATDDLKRAEELAQNPQAGIVQKIEEFLIASEEQSTIAASQSKIAQAASQKAAAATTLSDAKSAAAVANQASVNASQAAEKNKTIMQEAVPLLKACHNKSVRADFLFDKIVVLEGEAAASSILASRAAAEANAVVSQLEKEG